MYKNFRSRLSNLKGLTSSIRPLHYGVYGCWHSLAHYIHFLDLLKDCTTSFLHEDLQMLQSSCEYFAKYERESLKI